MSRYRDDDDGQVDGDASSPSPFATSMVAMPWLRGGVPPWHMWGNTIPIVIREFETEVAAPPVNTGQLIKVAYGRPDTFHWLLHSSIQSAPVTALPVQMIVEVHFDLIVGFGRAQSVIPDFAYFRWSWLTPTAPTPTTPKWTTQGVTPGLVDSIVPPIGPDATTTRLVTELVGQDIQMNVRAHAYKEDGTSPGDEVRMEVSGFFAPKNHIRPDWYVPGSFPVEARFPGQEIGAK